MLAAEKPTRLTCIVGGHPLNSNTCCFGLNTIRFVLHFCQLLLEAPVLGTWEGLKLLDLHRGGGGFVESASGHLALKHSACTKMFPRTAIIRSLILASPS